MSEYIHEIVLQEYIIENIEMLELTVQYKNISREKIIDARSNKTGTFWDLEGKLENGVWIPIEVEWITHNFYAHKHDKNKNYEQFLKKNGILLVLRKNKETPNMQQLSILENLTEALFKNHFKKWFKNRADEFTDETLKDYMVGKYKRHIPRVIIYPLSKNASNNYFPDYELYKKKIEDPFILGFKETGYKNNAFIRDLQPHDICLFIDANGSRCKRNEFIDKIKRDDLDLFRIAGYKISSKVIDKRAGNIDIDEFYWPDEIKKSELIYPYICRLEERPFIEKLDTSFPFIAGYSDDTWEAFRSCIQYGEYREISSLDFLLLISNL